MLDFQRHFPLKKMHINEFINRVDKAIEHEQKCLQLPEADAWRVDKVHMHSLSQAFECWTELQDENSSLATVL